MDKTLGLNRRFAKDKTKEEIQDTKQGEGHYLFMPEWRDPLPHPYSKLVEDVIYQQGQFVEQWTVLFNDPKTKEQAIIKVLSSPHLGEVVEITVELNSVPIADEKSKDITVNFKMYDGFKANKTFWTDSNGLQMQ